MMTSANPAQEWGKYGGAVVTDGTVYTSTTRGGEFIWCAFLCTTAGAIITATMINATTGWNSTTFSDLTTVPAGVVLYGEMTVFTGDGTIEGVLYYGKRSAGQA